MPFDFSLTPRVEQWRNRITGFVDDVVIPREQDAFAGGVDDVLRKELQQEAKAAGLWAPQAPAVQLCGGLGTSEEMVVGRIYADVRAFRIYDGASEVHRMSIAKRAARRARAHAGHGD